MRFLHLIAALLAFAALSPAAERSVKVRRHNAVAHMCNGKVIAVTTVTPYGGERVSVQGLNPKVAIYIRNQTRPLPARLAVRVWHRIK